jgi:hypothetical protein
MAAPERFAKRQIALAPRAPSIHGPARLMLRLSDMSGSLTVSGRSGNRKIVRNPNFKRRFDFSSTVMRSQQSSLICLLPADLKREEKRT